MEEYEIFNIVYEAIVILNDLKGGKPCVGLTFFKSSSRSDEYVFTIHFYNTQYLTRFELKLIEEVIAKAN